MTRGCRVVAAVLVAATAIAAGAALFGVGVATAAGQGVLHAAVHDATRATRPFRSLTQTRVRVGDEVLHVVIADQARERYRGLRRRRDLGRYGGMLFVFPTGTRTAFTMSTVPVPLDIGFYDERGRVVDHLQMEPCAGSDAECPPYEADGRFTYALETLAGRLPPGRIRPVSAAAPASK